MRLWSRRAFLKILGLSTALSFLFQQAEAGTIFLKKLLGRPPRETLAITPNSEFYVYHYGNSAYRLVKDLDIKKWSLYITGKVDLPRQLTYLQILELKPTKMIATIECIENPVGGESIGNAAWQGILLNSLLTDVGILPDVRDVILKGADGYTDSITLKQALSGNVLLAYEMNGKQLPREHGFPLRTVVPGIYGMKNVKWLTEIELVDHNYQGYWQQRGWSDTARVRLTSRFDFPGHYQELPLKEHVLRGIAFSGDRGIQSVALSFNNGKSWKEAQVDQALSEYSWVTWKFRWTPPSTGMYQLTVRATDQSGNQQLINSEPAFPNGPSGLHGITVQIVA